MKFKVIDKKTGKEADVEEIALHEDWAKGLVYCDIEGFAITGDGELILADECGKFAYCPDGRFEVQFDSDKALEERPQGEWIPVSERSPKEDGRYYVTRHDYVTKTNFTDLLWYEKGIWWNRQSTGEYAVIAWMPKPEPYKEEENEV